MLMKLKIGIKSVFAAVAAAVLSFALMSSTAYLYLKADTAKKAADSSDSSVPYKQKKENRGVMFAFPDSTGCLFHLDFNNCGITAVLTENYDPKVSDYGGYRADFTVISDLDLVQGLVDRAGGVELEFDGEKLRFTGFQITELLSVGAKTDVKRDIVKGVLESFAYNGFTASDLVYIIENSKTDLTVPDCYGWHEDLPQMCENVNIFYIT